MKKELHKPHDNFFRAVFAQEDNARDLLLSVLPQGTLRLLDLRSIKVEDTTLIDNKLSERHSDLLIRTSLRSVPVLIYILVEHKSYPDRWTLFQLLKYMVRIWERERSQHGKRKTLTSIIPVIFYHGTRRWRLPLNFSSYFVPEDRLEPYIPEFHPVMVNLQQMEDRKLQGRMMVQIALKTLKHSLGNLRSYLVEILGSATNLPMDAEHRAFLSKLLEYIIEGCKDIEEQDVEQALLSIGSREAREAYMTLAEKLIEKGKAEGKLKGRQEGKAEGKREGRLEGKREGELQGKFLGKKEVLLKLLTQKFGVVADTDKRKIMETRDLDKLDQALGLIFKTETIAEVLRPLD